MKYVALICLLKLFWRRSEGSKDGYVEDSTKKRLLLSQLTVEGMSFCYACLDMCIASYYILQPAIGG